MNDVVQNNDDNNTVQSEYKQDNGRDGELTFKEPQQYPIESLHIEPRETISSNSWINPELELTREHYYLTTADNTDPAPETPGQLRNRRRPVKLSNYEGLVTSEDS